jgi:hypothetical protein
VLAKSEGRQAKEIAAKTEAVRAFGFAISQSNLVLDLGEREKRAITYLIHFGANHRPREPVPSVAHPAVLLRSRSIRNDWSNSYRSCLPKKS